MPEDRRKATAFERHAQTGIALLLVALIGWVGITTQATQVKVAELTVEVNHLKDIVGVPQTRLDDLTRRVELIERHVIDNGLHGGNPYNLTLPRLTP